MVIAALTALGFTLSLPYGDNAAYDLVVDMDKTLKKVQVKTMLHRRGNTMYFRTCSVQKHIVSGIVVGSRITPYTTDCIDFIAAYSPVLKRVYLIPIEDIVQKGTVDFTLRIGKRKKHGKHKHPSARKYEVFRFESRLAVSAKKQSISAKKASK